MAREMRIWITRAAAGLEMLTGAALIAAPSLLAELLFGSPLTAPGPTVGRVAGLAILCLAIGCWPSGMERGQMPHARRGLWLLSAAVAGYLIWLGLSGGPVGILFWPAAATHLALAVLLAGASLKGG
jgi:hypothetical protein